VIRAAATPTPANPRPDPAPSVVLLAALFAVSVAGGTLVAIRRDRPRVTGPEREATTV
jgi:hypothetical protein